MAILTPQINQFDGQLSEYVNYYSSHSLIILIPLYNDWRSVSKLLKEIDLQTNNWNAEVSVIIINDASTEEKSGIDSNYKKIKSG